MEIKDFQGFQSFKNLAQRIRLLEVTAPSDMVATVLAAIVALKKSIFLQRATCSR